ncbi:LacI family DNA-binding transcriptional regulator [Arthrobacter sp. NPDC058130]|uniref:LacI family DNA-binding transcriptional regulator n=1 Tax=Arthrobacter sp. NPDC058130 TaxID=3346353 RepID=UPI0036E6E105
MILSKGERPTLAYIAQSVGVSTSTVSKVLNGRDDVAAATRTDILEALRKAGYRSPAQRRLTAGPIVVEVALDGFSACLPTVLGGILETASEEGVDVRLSIASGSGPKRDSDRKSQPMPNKRRDGLIIVTTASDDSDLTPLRAQSIPVVVVDPFNSRSGVVSIGATNWAGGRSATEHLLNLGHRRIAYLGGPASAECNQARMHGYCSALMLSGIDITPGLVIHGKFHVEHGVAGLAELLASPNRPTAIFAANDDIAVGVLREAHRRRIRVPEDLSLVGFDGTVMAENSVPALTSVAQPLRDMGRTALRALLRQVRGEQLGTDRFELTTSLVIRESTGPVIAGQT